MSRYWLPSLLIFVLGSFVHVILYEASTVEASIPPYTIEGDTVYINDSNAYISATPHTLKDSGWVYVNISSKSYTGNIDVLFGFNTTLQKPRKALLYSPHYETEMKSFTCPSGNKYSFNYTTSPKHFWCWYNSSSVNNQTGKMEYSLKLVKEGDFDSGNLATRTATWSEQKLVEYTDISDRFNSVNYDYDGKNKWYYVTNVPIIAGQGYLAKVWIDVPPRYRTEPDAKGKYSIAIKRSDQTITQAISSGTLYLLDPWWDSSWARKNNITITNANSSHVLPAGSNVTISIDTTGSTHDTNQTRIVYNGDTQLDYENLTAFNDTATRITFNITADIAAGANVDNYEVFHDNPNAGPHPSNLSKIYPLGDRWDDGDYTDTPMWTVKAGTWNASNNYLEETTSGLNGWGEISVPVTYSSRMRFTGKIKSVLSGNGNLNINLYFYSNVSDVSAGAACGAGEKYYNWLTFAGENTATNYLRVCNAGTLTQLDTGVFGGITSFTAFNVIVNDTGIFIFNETGLALSSTDTSIRTGSYFNFEYFESSGDNQSAQLDDFLVMKILTPEPTTSVGAEETNLPVITISSPGNITTSNQTIQINATSSLNIDDWNISVDGGVNESLANEGVDSANGTYTLSSTGNHNFRICANASSTGNIGCSTGYFTADWVAPSGFSPTANETVYSGNPMTPKFNVTDDFYTGTNQIQYNYSWDDVETVNNLATNGTEETISKTASLGNHTLNLTIRDGATNNLTTGQYTYILDNKTLIYGVNNILHSNGNITRDPAVLDNASSTFTSWSVNSNNATFYSTSGSTFQLKDFSSQVTITINGKGTLTLTPSSTLTYYNETGFTTDQWSFEASGTDGSSLTLTRTGFNANTNYQLYIDGIADKTVTTDSSGMLSDTVSLSTKSIIYLRVAGGTGGSGGSGGGGGGGVRTKYCEKLGVNVLEGEWTTSKCTLEEGVEEPIRKEARIIYFGQDWIGLPYSLESCKIVFGGYPGCRETTIETQKTTRVLGAVWSTTSIIGEHDYNWEIWDLTRDEIYQAVNTTEFQTIFTYPGEFRIRLRVVEEDTNTIYEAEHNFTVTGEALPRTNALQFLENTTLSKEQVNTLYDKLKSFYAKLTGKLSNDLGGIKTIGLSTTGEATEKARGEPYMVLFIIIGSATGIFIFREVLK